MMRKSTQSIEHLLSSSTVPNPRELAFPRLIGNISQNGFVVKLGHFVNRKRPIKIRSICHGIAVAVPSLVSCRRQKFKHTNTHIFSSSPIHTSNPCEARKNPKESSGEFKIQVQAESSKPCWRYTTGEPGLPGILWTERRYPSRVATLWFSTWKPAFSIKTQGGASKSTATQDQTKRTNKIILFFFFFPNPQVLEID